MTQITIDGILLQKLMQDGNVYCPNVFHTVMINGFMKIISNERIPREDQGLLFE